MIKGYGSESPAHGGYQIALVEKSNIPGVKNKCYTIQIEVHEVDQGSMYETTIIRYDSIDQGVLKALAEAMQEIGLFPRSANDAELKATKFHLEDMRKIVFKEKE